MSFVNYRNGNYVVYFNIETGDKVRNVHGNEYRPVFAENCDVTITEYCDGGCAFCYAGCGLNGRHGDLNAKFLDTLHPYTELAINGNDLSHPDLESFLIRMAQRRVIVNVTVNQMHFEKYVDKLISWQSQRWINGIGASFVKPSDCFVQYVQKCKNVVVHVVEGVVSKEDFDFLANKNLNVLILGYKTTGRGQKYLDHNSSSFATNHLWLKENLDGLFGAFKSVSFDNLALENLDVRLAVSEEDWARHYMGNDGDFTFFINLVDGYFAKNSTSPLHYPLMDSVDEMFAFIQKEKGV